LLILGIVVRLLMGVRMRAASDSLLAVGILHQIFDASNNNGGRVDSLLAGADAGNIQRPVGGGGQLHNPGSPT
jgi:hypothetical protein